MLLCLKLSTTKSLLLLVLFTFLDGLDDTITTNLIYKKEVGV